MEVKFIQFPEHNVMPKGIIGESILFELSEPSFESPLSKYWLQCHQCGLHANLGDHDSVEVKDGLVTITPSLDCPKCPAHYWIKDGKVV